MGCEEAIGRRWSKTGWGVSKARGWIRLAFTVAKWVPGEDQGSRHGGQSLGPAGGGAESWLGGWVCESLRVELGAGRGGGGGANGGMAAVCRAAREQGGDGGGDEGGGGGEREGGRWVGEWWGSGEESDRGYGE